MDQKQMKECSLVGAVVATMLVVAFVTPISTYALLDPEPQPSAQPLLVATPDNRTLLSMSGYLKIIYVDANERSRFIPLEARNVSVDPQFDDALVIETAYNRLNMLMEYHFDGSVRVRSFIVSQTTKSGSKGLCRVDSTGIEFSGNKSYSCNHKQTLECAFWNEHGKPWNANRLVKGNNSKPEPQIAKVELVIESMQLETRGDPEKIKERHFSKETEHCRSDDEDSSED